MQQTVLPVANNLKTPETEVGQLIVVERVQKSVLAVPNKIETDKGGIGQSLIETLVENEMSKVILD